LALTTSGFGNFVVWGLTSPRIIRGWCNCRKGQDVHGPIIAEDASSYKSEYYNLHDVVNTSFSINADHQEENYSGGRNVLGQGPMSLENHISERLMIYPLNTSPFSITDIDYREERFPLADSLQSQQSHLSSTPL